MINGFAATFLLLRQQQQERERLERERREERRPINERRTSPTDTAGRVYLGEIDK